VLDESTAVGVLQRRLEAVEMDLHSDHEKLHEIRSTLAGISTATDLLHRSGISPARREQLHDMTAAELRRLQRLVTRRASGTTSPVELDEALQPIVVRHRTEGLPVIWSPSGHVALARPDDVAEIVNVLLANARRHAGGGPVTVDVSQGEGRVELAVSDSGPGVAPAVRARLFQWGARRAGSPGEGIGLAAARLLAGSLGGHLRLESGAGPGATFVLSLASAPAARPALHDVVS
jgi:signal transduction histidine kinase